VDLLIVRHAIAEEQAGGEDAARRLTPEGRRRMRRSARGLAELVGEVEAIATSPLLRAAETAELLREALGGPPPVEVAALRPGARPEALLPWLREHQARATVAVVGHEPHLSALAAWLVTGRAVPLFPLRKGGACLVALERAAGAGAGSLRWLATAGMLRRLGGGRAG